MLSNWKGVEKAVKAATNSTGSAEKENEKYLNSIEGKTKAVESAMQKLASATVDDNLIKWFLDVEKIIINLTTSIGGLTPVILLLVTLFSSKLVPALSGIISIFGKTRDAILGAQVAANGLSSTGVFAIISLGLTVISAAVGAFNSYKNSLKEAREESISAAKATLDSSKSLSELYAKYQILYKTQDKTKQQEEELVATSKSLEDALGNRANTLKTLTEGTSDYNTELAKAIQTQAGIDFSKVTSGINDFKKNLDFSDYEIAIPQLELNNGVQDVISRDAFKILKDFTAYKDELANTFENYEDNAPEAGISSIEDASAYLESLIQLQASYNEKIVQANYDGNTLLATQISENEMYTRLNTVIPDLTAKLSEYNSMLVAQAVAEKQMSGEYPQTESAYIAFRNEIINNIGATGEWKNQLLELINTYFPQYSDSLNSLTGSNYISKTKDWKDAVSSLSSEISNLDDATEKLSKAAAEYNENGSLSYDTMKSLLGLGSDYLSYLSLENGKLLINKAGVEALMSAKKAELLQDLEMARSSEILDARETAREQLYNLRESHLSEIETSERENEINSVLDDSINSITASYGNQIEMVSLLGTKLADTVDELNVAKEAYEKQNDALDDAQSAYDVLSSAIEEYNESGVLSVDTLQSLFSLSPEYLQMFFDQASALGEAQAATMAHVEALKQAKIEEIAASAAAQILAVSQRLAGGAGSSAAGGVSSLGDSAATMGNKASAAAPKVGGLAVQVANLYSAMGGTIDIDWANKEIQNIMNNANKLVGEISNLGVSSLSGKSGKGGSGGSSAASERAQAISDANEKLLDTTMKMIKAQKEDQIEVLEDELDLEEKLYDAEKKRLEEQIDKYKDVIDAKQKSLKLDKEQREYDDEIADKNKEISDIQNRLTELEFDTSASAMSEKLKLQEELAGKQKDLSESQADREYDLTNQALDDDYEAYKTSQESQIDLLNQNFEATKTDYQDRIQLLKDYLEEEGTIRTDALNMMGTKSAEFYNNLFAWNARYGDVTNATLQSIIDKAYEVVSISSGSKKSGTKKTSVVSKTVGTSVDWKSLKAHHDGLDSGFVGSGLDGNEEFIKALRGEAYATPKQQDKYMDDILPNMLRNAYVSGMTNVSAGMTMQYEKMIEINVSGSIDSDSVSKVQSAMNQGLSQLTNALAQRGTVRKANAFAT